MNKYTYNKIPNSKDINRLNVFHYYVASISKVSQYLITCRGEQYARRFLSGFVKNIPGIKYLENKKIKDYLLGSTQKAHE